MSTHPHFTTPAPASPHALCFTCVQVIPVSGQVPVHWPVAVSNWQRFDGKFALMSGVDFGRLAAFAGGCVGTGVTGCVVVAGTTGGTVVTGRVFVVVGTGVVRVVTGRIGVIGVVVGAAVVGVVVTGVSAGRKQYSACWAPVGAVSYPQGVSMH